MTPAEAADILDASGRAFVHLLRSMPEEMASWRPAPEEWCANECVGHIIECDRRAFAGRIQLILDSDNPGLEPWDQPAVARARHDCEKKADQLIAEFEPVRREGLNVLRSLRDEQLVREGVHPKVGRLSVDDLIHEWVHHDGNHMRQLLANVQAFVWPGMGNARRFSSG